MASDGVERRVQVRRGADNEDIVRKTPTLALVQISSMKIDERREGERVSALPDTRYTIKGGNRNGLGGKRPPSL